MDDKDRKELAEAIGELYRVVDTLIAMLEQSAARGVNTPIQQVAQKMQQAKWKVGKSLQRMVGTSVPYP